MKKKYLYLLSLLFFPEIKPMHLFEYCTALKNTIPHMQLAQLPTPIDQCHNLQNRLQHPHIFMKRDDLTGYEHSYGGNKVRKLEFLLADALHHNAKQIITFGSFGTNHGLATACYSQKLGLDCILMLKPQPNSPVVQQNLLLDHYFNARIQLFATTQERNAALDLLLHNNKDAYFIPTGGSIPLGALGYVNAALEFKKQIDAGIMPEPDVIYIAMGSCGTVAGLLLGFQIARMKSKIRAISVEPEEAAHCYYDTIKKLFLDTNQLLHHASHTIPFFEFPDTQLQINKDFCGEAYGLWPACVDDSARIMQQEEHINLEGTYSAKAITALIADVTNNAHKKNDVILFWNTYCGLDFSRFTDTIDYKHLNAELHAYFENIT